MRKWLFYFKEEGEKGENSSIIHALNEDEAYVIACYRWGYQADVMLRKEIIES